MENMLILEFRFGGTFGQYFRMEVESYVWFLPVYNKQQRCLQATKEGSDSLYIFINQNGFRSED